MRKIAILRTFAKEPLSHFLVIGAALFLLYQWQNPISQVEDNEILVTSADVTRLLSGFERTWQRPSTGMELDGLIDNFVRDEIYYREARALGLDQDDIVVRRRLRQKLEFILEDVAGQVEPSDEELTTFMARSPEKYIFEAMFSFRQVYLNPAVRGEKLEDDIKRLLDQLHLDETESLNPSSLSDPSLLPAQVSRWRASTVAANFGKRFVEGLANLEQGVWFGPVESQLGSHLVVLHEFQQGYLPTLSEIRASVRNDWLRQRRDDYADRTYRELRDRYQVTIEATEVFRGPDIALRGQRK